MSAIQGRPGDHAAAAGRCVVLSAAAAPATQQLLAALNRRGLTVVLVGDAPRAMLEVTRHGALALIVADPAGVAGAAELVDAVRAYRPRTVCWQYENCKLAPINGHLAGVTLSQAPRDRPDPRQLLRADHDRLSGLVVHAQPRDPADAEPLVSEDELAMLLGPLPDEAAEA